MGRKKARLNLYLDKELLDFAKKWSYVASVPISGMLEEHLRRQQERLQGVSPFQWLTDPANNPGATPENGELTLESYLANREEEEFCRLNPGHLRARLRSQLMAEFRETRGRVLEEQKQREREFIARWLEVFPLK